VGLDRKVRQERSMSDITGKSIQYRLTLKFHTARENNLGKCSKQGGKETKTGVWGTSIGKIPSRTCAVVRCVQEKEGSRVGRCEKKEKSRICHSPIER